MRKNKPAQIIRVKQDLWDRLRKLIPDPEGRGRRPKRGKECLEAIIYVLRTGCQWAELPKDYPPKSTVHLRFTTWCQRGIFKKLWEMLIIEYDDLKGLDWEWISGDCVIVKAPLGGEKNR